jgi:hypothetical protein
MAIKGELIMPIWMTLASVLILTAFAWWRASVEARREALAEIQDDDDMPPMDGGRM